MSDENNNENGGPVYIIAGGSPAMQFPKDAELGRHSMLRIQDLNQQDLATIDLHTGKITLHDPDHVDEAAKTFWQAIATCFKYTCCQQPFRDMVFLAGTPGRSRAGDLRMKAGTGSPTHVGAPGGDIVINGEAQLRPSKEVK